MPAAAPADRPQRPAGATPRGVASWLVALLLAWTTGPRAAVAHPHDSTPPVDLVLTYAAGGLDALLDLSKYQLASWVPRPPRYVDLDADIPDDVIVERVLSRVSVEADGRPLTPVLRRQQPGQGPDPVHQPRLQLLLHYPCPEPPSSVRVVWKEFLGIWWENGPQVPVVVEVGTQIDSATLTPTEPELIWRRRPPAAFRSRPAPPAPQAAARELPVAALGLAALALALPFVGPWRRRRLPTRLAPSAAALLLAGGALLLPLGRVASPFGRAQPPSEGQARTIFAALLAGVYRAFDATTEKGIYDALAASVEPALLRDLYGEVYESLVLRETGGGAVCRVQEVTPGELAVRFPSDGGTMQFDVEAAWTVVGRVDHWGHPHTRENLYRGLLTVRNDGASWRIAGVTLHEHRRIDDGRRP